jgi:hypothetical protein
MLLGLHCWAGGHIVIVIENGHIPDITNSTAVHDNRDRLKP